MRQLWVRRRVAAPAQVVWELLVDTRRWAEWGPTVRRVRHDGARIDTASQGQVETPGGLWLPFRVTAFDPPRRWAWRVAGLPATEHRVEPRPDGTCVAAIGVPWPAAPYLLLAWAGLRRLEGLALAAVSPAAAPPPMRAPRGRRPSAGPSIAGAAQR